jgi:hypothetical protein
MIKAKRFGMMLLVAAAAAAWAGETVLPALSGLPELKIGLELDFADHPVAGLPWLGHVRSSEFVFFDIKLHQVFRAALPDGDIRKIGGPGQGPGEYEGVLDIYLDGKATFVLDGRGRIIAYGHDGKVVRDMKPPLRFERFLGLRKDLYFLEGRGTTPETFGEKILASWREGGEAKVLLKSSADVVATKAADLNGKAMGGGHFTLSEPVFALFDEGFVEASGSLYRLRFFDPVGKAAGTWSVIAPKPEFAEAMFKSYNGRRSAYAVRAVFPLPSGLAVVGNYFRDGRPRLDVFDRQGRIRGSYLIPLTWEAPYSRCQIENGRLIYFSSQEGCRIYRIISPL